MVEHRLWKTRLFGWEVSLSLLNVLIASFVFCLIRWDRLEMNPYDWQRQVFVALVVVELMMLVNFFLTCDALFLA